MFKSFKIAITGLLANPVRTMLTTLGIVIGIAVIIIVLAAGEGFKGFIEAQVDAFGSNAIFVETRVPPTTKQRAGSEFSQSTNTGSAQQAVAITSLRQRDIDEIARLSNIKGAYGAVIGQKVAAYRQTSKNAFIFGASPVRFQIDGGKLATGRGYTEQENKSLAQVAVLGADIAEDLFGESDPVGQTIRVGEYNFEVVGVYERRGSFGFSQDDQQVFVPLLTAQKKLLGIDYLFYIIAQADNEALAELTAEDMKAVLRRNHQITDPDKDDFLVTTAAQGLETFGTILSGVTFLLIAIATISLIVGGVGIMNTMYVAVTERTPEVGLKKAIGATSGDILMEFLVEAILLTIVGGVIGIVAGSGIAFAVAKIASSQGVAWNFSIPVLAIVLGLGVSGVLGLLFGVFPAFRASKLDPVEALRYE